MYKYIYGPVPSRRLGISLGVDLVPHKVCNLDCVYCECGATDCFSTLRKEYVPVSKVLAELDDYLSKNPLPDWITLSGSGEPTLNIKTGELIREVKKRHPAAKIAVLTNGTTLCDPLVRAELLEADLVLPNLDAATNEAFLKIDRPVPGICGEPDRPFEVSVIIEAIAKFVKEYKSSGAGKQVWLETFIVEGVNTGDADIQAFRIAFAKIAPDRVQLNTLDRPGTETWVKPAPRDVLEAMVKKIGLPNVEIVSKYRRREDIPRYRGDVEMTIIGIVSRRPSTVDDIAEALGMHVHEAYAYLDVLQRDGKIKPEIRERGIFWKPVSENSKGNDSIS